MISTSAKTYAPGKCAWCTGTGKRNIAPGLLTSCIVCGGKGFTSVAQPAYPCGPCQGSGRRDNTTLCHTCDGTGWEHIAVAKIG